MTNIVLYLFTSLASDGSNLWLNKWPYTLYCKKAIEDGEYCTAVYIDVSQDEVWHQGLLFKIKKIPPEEIYKILYSCLSARYFFVKVKEITNIIEISFGILQGCVLDTILYSIYTADLPLSTETSTATFAGDTIIMSVIKNPEIATNKVLKNG